MSGDFSRLLRHGRQFCGLPSDVAGFGFLAGACPPPHPPAGGACLVLPSGTAARTLVVVALEAVMVFVLLPTASGDAATLVELSTAATVQAM